MIPESPFPNEFLKTPLLRYHNTEMTWISSDCEDQYEKVKNKVPYSPNDVTYKFNNFGFRCDDFESWEKYPYRILFAGCSITEGIGVPLEDCWAKIFHKRLCENIGHNIPYWNIGKSATGFDQMLRYLYHFGDMLRPQIIISFLPDKSRREISNDMHWGTWWDVDPTLTKPLLKTFSNETIINYQTEKNLSMINFMLDRWNTEFLYLNVAINKENLNYSNFYGFEICLHDFIIEGNYARDGIHPGKESNINISNLMFDNLWKKIETKLGLTNLK